MTHDNNLIRVMTEDHRHIEEVFGELESHRGHFDERKGLVDHAIAETERHFAAEERFVYPEARRSLNDGDEVVGREIVEHQQVEELMRDLEIVGPEHPHFEQKLREFIDGYRRHVGTEERELIPKLKAACSETELEEIGDKLLWAKATAPTRPDPHAEKQLPADRTLGPGEGFMDKIRDSLGPRQS